MTDTHSNVLPVLQPANPREAFLAELDREATSTRALLAQLPSGRLDWRPHPRSHSLGELAIHLVRLPAWTPTILERSELDLATHGDEPMVPVESAEVALTTFEANLAVAAASLGRATEATFQEAWTLRTGEQVISVEPKHGVLRHWVFNHLVHHRAQLGVFLRLLDCPLPQVYGPTADAPGE